MDLPDIYLLFSWNRDTPPCLVHRERAGTVHRSALLRMRPLPEALVLYGPGPAPRDEKSVRFVEAALARGGSVLPLSRVLRGLGIRRRISPELLRELGGTWDAVDDPRDFAEELLRRLGDMLEVRNGIDECAGQDDAGGSGAALRDLVREAPEGPGVYAFLTRDNRALYVGKATSLRRRLESHLRGASGNPPKPAAWVRDANSVRWERLGSELEALIREHLWIRREIPALNTQRSAHPRRRGRWRATSAALVLPSVASRHNELCLVSGAGSFHWERVPRRVRMPRGTWTRVAGFLEGSFAGWGPGEADRLLEPDERRELAEITLTWLAVREPEVTRVDLSETTATRELAARLGRALGVDPGEGRVEVR